MFLSLKVLGCGDAFRPISRALFVAQHATLSRNWWWVISLNPEADCVPVKDVMGRLLHGGDAGELYRGTFRLWIQTDPVPEIA